MVEQVQVMIFDFPQPRFVPVAAVVHRGLALHRPVVLDDDGRLCKLTRGWQITHVNSGKAISCCPLDTTLSRAASVFRWLADVYNWQRPEEALDFKKAEDLVVSTVDLLQIRYLDEAENIYLGGGKMAAFTVELACGHSVLWQEPPELGDGGPYKGLPLYCPQCEEDQEIVACTPRRYLVYADGSLDVFWDTDEGGFWTGQDGPFASIREAVEAGKRLRRKA